MIACTRMHGWGTSHDDDLKMLGLQRPMQQPWLEPMQPPGGAAHAMHVRGTLGDPTKPRGSRYAARVPKAKAPVQVTTGGSNQSKKWTGPLFGGMQSQRPVAAMRQGAAAPTAATRCRGPWAGAAGSRGPGGPQYRRTQPPPHPSGCSMTALASCKCRSWRGCGTRGPPAGGPWGQGGVGWGQVGAVEHEVHLQEDRGARGGAGGGVGWGL